jgi:hypothetical protein
MSDSDGIGMSDPSRRGLLIMAGAGAAAVGAASLAPAASAAPNAKADEPVTVKGPLVAYVSDLSRGEVSVMMGEREVLVHDPVLCASLARIIA